MRRRLTWILEEEALNAGWWTEHQTGDPVSRRWTALLFSFWVGRKLFTEMKSYSKYSSHVILYREVFRLWSATA